MGRAIRKREWRNREVALALAREYEASGLTQREFCQQRGVALSTFALYRRRARSAAAQPELIPVRVLTGAGLVVAHPSGMRIEVGAGFDAFDFRLGRERAGPQKWLGQWNGVLQTDGYAAYEGIGGPGLVHLGCWSHARRKFVDALKLQPDHRGTIAVVGEMNALFAIDREAREQGFDTAHRHEMRQAEAPARLEAIRQAVERVRSDALPGGELAKAVHYALAQWPKLTRFLDHPEAELSNNVAENSMRPLAVGRKNWIHVGSLAAGPKVAAILSVIESCRRMGIPLRPYLAAVLPGLADMPVSRLHALTPAAWAAAKQ